MKLPLRQALRTVTALGVVNAATLSSHGVAAADAENASDAADRAANWQPVAVTAAKTLPRSRLVGAMLQTQPPPNDEQIALEEALTFFESHLDFIAGPAPDARHLKPEDGGVTAACSRFEELERLAIQRAMPAENRRHPGLQVQDPMFLDQLARSIADAPQGRMRTILVVPTAKGQFHTVAVDVLKTSDFNSVVMLDTAGFKRDRPWNKSARIAFDQYLPERTHALHACTGQQVEWTGCLPASLSLVKKLFVEDETTLALHAMNRSAAMEDIERSKQTGAKVDRIRFVDALPAVAASMIKHTDSADVAERWIDLHGGVDPVVNAKGETLRERVNRPGRSISQKLLVFTRRAIADVEDASFADGIIGQSLAPLARQAVAAGCLPADRAGDCDSPSSPDPSRRPA